MPATHAAVSAAALLDPNHPDLAHRAELRKLLQLQATLGLSPNSRWIVFAARVTPEGRLRSVAVPGP